MELWMPAVKQPAYATSGGAMLAETPRYSFIHKKGTGLHCHKRKKGKSLFLARASRRVSRRFVGVLTPRAAFFGVLVVVFLRCVRAP